MSFEFPGFYLPEHFRQVLNLKNRYEKKAFRRLLNVLSTPVRKHLLNGHIRLKAPSGEYGLSFVAFKSLFIMSAFHFTQLMIYCPVYTP